MRKAIKMNELCSEIHDYAKSKGFYDNHRDIGTMLMLCVSELSEALEADRDQNYAKIHDKTELVFQRTLAEDLVRSLEVDDNLVSFANLFKTTVKDTFEDEIADTVIRLFDLCGYLNIDIESHVKYKMIYNETRAKMHGKKY